MKMKRRNLIIAALIVFVGAAAAYMLLRPNTFTQEKMRITINLPNGWEARDRYIPERKVVLRQTGTESEESNPVAFSIFEMRQEEVDGFENDWDLEGLRAYVESRLQSAQIEFLGTEELTIDGYDAFRVDYQGTEGEVKPRERRYYYFLNDRAFEIEFVGSTDTFDAKIVEVEQMINLIDLLDS